MKCDLCNTNDETVLEVQYPSESETHHYCGTHLRQNGFCYMCGYFSAGIESYDFSPVTGLCAECLDEIKYETGEYDDVDWYED